VFGLLLYLSHKGGFEKAHDAHAQANRYICFSSELDDLIVANLQKDETGQWFCLQCNFASRKVSHVKTHIESKHVQTGGFICPICSKVSATRESLRKHIARLHWNIAVSTDCFLYRFGWVDRTKYAKRWIRHLGLHAVWLFIKPEQQFEEPYRSQTYTECRISVFCLWCCQPNTPCNENAYAQKAQESMELNHYFQPWMMQ